MTTQIITDKKTHRPLYAVIDDVPYKLVEI